MPPGAKTCIVTGANGFLGGKLTRFLRSEGWRVIEWVRNPVSESDQAAMSLGSEVEPVRFNGVDAFVHCAYDFTRRSWDEIARINISGSRKLLDSARRAGVKRLIFVSSLSAFPGCRSMYGKAKLEIERHASEAGALSIRPGLIYGDHPGGVFGKLVGQVKSSSLIPLLLGSPQTQYLLHSDDLSRFVFDYLVGEIPHINTPITIAHEQSWPLKDIFAEIAKVIRKPIRFIPLPWQAVWLGLKSLETVGYPTNFRSDSLLGLVYQNPNPSFQPLEQLGVKCRPFQISASMLGA